LASVFFFASTIPGVSAIAPAQDIVSATPSAKEAMSDRLRPQLRRGTLVIRLRMSCGVTGVANWASEPDAKNHPISVVRS
jgi:hypothetical protein